VFVLCLQGEKWRRTRRTESHLTEELTSLLIIVALPEMEKEIMSDAFSILCFHYYPRLSPVQ
jgi:hypothetical protein